MNTEIEKNEKYFDVYDKLLADYQPIKNGSREKILEFFRSFPDLPTDPSEAFAFIQDNLKTQGFTYENETFLLEDVIENKKGNCLGLSVLFATILEGKGHNLALEVGVNPQDGHYTNDIKQFKKFISGDVFDYDNLPDLPHRKVEFPQNRFVPLEHPVIVLGDERFETTSLLQDSEDIIHDYKNESSRQVTLKNLLGSLYTCQAKIESMGDTPNYESLVKMTEHGLELWPEDRQGWIFARDLGRATFNDTLIETAEKKFLEQPSDDSLYYLSRAEITGDQADIEKALEKYPAYVSAYIAKSVKLPLKTEEEKKEARFDLTAGALAVANSQELSLDFFYLSHIEELVQAFGEEEVENLLYDMHIDEKAPLHHNLAMYDVERNPEWLVKAWEAGALEKSSPLEQLRFCTEVLKQSSENSEIAKVQEQCQTHLTDLDQKFGKSKFYSSVKEQLS